ncbi:enoyl-CoA hydratase/isomerase family protein [Desulfallas sp. Bu1-1]|uniref:enoyl-CoA hydratase/isomerase family protein n=1 Tax=Desulfallas sp. Bu1-1 TaxID=2787620 RepID=UPI00189F5789|nr:enoyl-CoA hydratase/isomerase family protein [Desulfallas sp. Bu1-1]MBF7082550.1 enoyl-CoA hydratase/isomerase family protein [Desulfallas sp. Bu1-1]
MVKYEQNESVATIIIDNPPLNILDETIRIELMRLFEKVKENEDVRVLIIKGEGSRAFSVGSNLREFPLERGVAGGRAKVIFEQQLHDLLESLPQVTIAVLRGYVLGGGCELMMPCDLRIASEDAVFGFPEVKVGGFPCSGGTQRLLRLVGVSKAKELLLLGNQITAKEAEKLGLVNKVVPEANLDHEVLLWVKQLLNLPWQSLKAIKRCVNAGAVDPAKGKELEVEEYEKVFVTWDMREGINAFLEKRDPKFRHC